MADSRIAARYAKSLLDLARERGQVEEVTESMRALKVAVENRDFRVLLASPVITTDKKQAVIRAITAGYDEITSKFLAIVTSKRREEAIPAIVEEYLRQYRELKHISVVRLTSAAPLSDASVEAIKAKLIAGGLTETTIQLQREVDPSLIGGFILQVGDKLYDASARAKLATLRKEFTGNPYERTLR